MRKAVFILSAGSVLMFGCSQTREVQMAGGPGAMEEMKQPPVPEQMARLDAWLGTWAGTAEMISPSPEEMRQMMGPGAAEMPSTFKGEQKVEKVLGGMFVREEGTHDMGPDQRETYVMYFTWDAKAGKYRGWYFSDWGNTGDSWMTPSADGKSWMMEGTSVNARGQKSRGKGTLTMPDENTMEWTWTETGPHGKMELKGTSKRQSK